MASLMIGIDFYDTEVYVGLWAEDERCAKIFSVDKISDIEQPEKIPLFVCVDEAGKFYAGHEGIEYSIQNRCNGASLLYGSNVKERIRMNENDREYDVTELLAGFLGEVLNAIKRHFGGASIARLCLTGSRMNPVNEARLKKALELCEFPMEQAVIINHANAFAMYMLHMDEDKRSKRAAAIDLDRAGACIYAFVPYDNRSGAPSHVISADASEGIATGLESINEPEEKMKAFESVVNTAISHNLPLTRLFVTGKSVEDERVKSALRKYASDSFRIFSGQNLYSAGACYMAVAEPSKERTIFDGEVFHTISLEGYKDACIDAVEIIPAGTAVGAAEKTVNVILDGTNELIFHVTDLRNGNRSIVGFSPDDMSVRDNRTQRLEVNVKFLDIETLVIKVRDIGFGEIYPASFRVWEQVIQL